MANNRRICDDPAMDEGRKRVSPFPRFCYTLVTREEPTRSFRMAEEQFDENITLLGGEAVLAANDPEKFNLYAGLLNLARGLRRLEGEVDAIRQRVR